MTPFVDVPEHWHERAREFAERVSISLQNSIARGRTIRSDRDAEARSLVQYRARVAEIVLVLWFELDPETTLDWGTQQRADPGHDFVYKALRWDVKYTGTDYLFWPRKNNHKFPEAQFDRLVSIKLHDNGGTIKGWVSKRRFWRERSIAGEGHRLDAGTRYMEHGELTPIDEDDERTSAPPQHDEPAPALRPAKAAYYAKPGDETWLAARDEAKRLGKL